MTLVTRQLRKGDFPEDGFRLKRAARKSINYSSRNIPLTRNESPSATFVQKSTNDRLVKSKSTRILRSVELPHKLIHSTTEKIKAERIQKVKRGCFNSYGTNIIFPPQLNNELIFSSGNVSVISRKIPLTTSYSPVNESSTVDQKLKVGARKIENNTPDIARNFVDKKMSPSFVRAPAEFQNSGRTVVRQKEAKISIDSPYILPGGSLLRHNYQNTFAQAINTDEEEGNTSGDLACGTRLLRKRRSDPSGNPSEKVRVIRRKNEKAKLESCKIGVDKDDNISSNFLNEVDCDDSDYDKKVVNKINDNKPFNSKTMNVQSTTSMNDQSKVGKAIEVTGTSEESEIEIKSATGKHLFAAQGLQPSSISQSTFVQHLPNIDFIDGFQFLSFEEEEHLRQFERRNSTSARNGMKRIGGLRTRGSSIALSKTNDVTKIKGWRQKCFKSEAVIESKNTFGNSSLSNFSHKLSPAEERTSTEKVIIFEDKRNNFEITAEVAKNFEDAKDNLKFAENSAGKENTRIPEVADLDLAVFEEKLPDGFTCNGEDSQDDDYGCSPNEEINLNLTIGTLNAENRPKSAFTSNYLEDFLMDKFALKNNLGAKLKTGEPPSKFVWPTQAASPKIKPPPFRLNTCKSSKIETLLPHSLNTDSNERLKLSSPLNSQSNNNIEKISCHKMLNDNAQIPVDEMEATKTTSALVHSGKSSKYPGKSRKTFSPKLLPEEQLSAASKNYAENQEPLTVNISKSAAEFSLTALKLFKTPQKRSISKNSQETTLSVAQIDNEISPPSPYSPDLVARISDGEPVSGCSQPSCLLGCLCESLKVRKRERGHCGKSRCIFKCLCNTGKKVKEDSPVRPKRQTRLSTRLKDSFVWKNDSNPALDMYCDQSELQVNELKNEHNLRNLNEKRDAGSNQNMLPRELKFISKTDKRGFTDCKDGTRRRWKNLTFLSEQSSLPKSAKMRDLILHLKRLNYLIKPMMRAVKNSDPSIKDANLLLVDLAAQSIKRLQQNETGLLHAKRILMSRQKTLWNRVKSQMIGMNVEKQKAIVKDLNNRLQFSCKGMETEVRNRMNETRKNCLSQASSNTSYIDANQEIVLQDIVSETEFEDYLSVINSSDEDSDEPTDLADEHEPRNTLVNIPTNNGPPLFGIANFQRTRFTSSNNAAKLPAPHAMTNLTYPSAGQWKSLTPASLQSSFNMSNFRGTNSNTYFNNSFNVNNFKGSDKSVGAGSQTDSKISPNYFGTGTLLVPMAYNSRILVPLRVWPYVSQNGMHLKKWKTSKL